MMGALVDDPGWLSSVAGANRESLDQDSDKLAGHRRANGMIPHRFVLVMYHFEQALYADPDSAELNSTAKFGISRRAAAFRGPSAWQGRRLTGPPSSTSP